MWIYSTNGRDQSQRPKSKNDCTVRAYAEAFDLPFDTVYDMFARAGRKPHNGFNIQSILTQHKNVVWFSFPAEKGIKRWTPDQFCFYFDKGTYILRTARHVFAVKDGNIYDTSPNTGRCVYGAWWIKNETIAPISKGLGIVEHPQNA